MQFHDDKHTVSPRFEITAGGYWALLDSHLRLGSSALGVDLDVEEFLDLDSSQWAFRVGALYRIGKKRRHAIGLDWFRFNRSGNRQITSDITLPPELGGGMLSTS